MSSARFEWNPDFEDQIQRAAVAAVQERFQPIMDQLHEQYAGRPVEEVRGSLSDAWHAAGGKISDPELTTYAEAISAGHRIVLR